MAKTAVYSWRLAPDLKLALEEAARERGASIAEILEQIVRDGLARWQGEGDEAEQRRLHKAAAKWVGAISGDDPDRSTRVRELVREQLARQHGREP